MAQNLIERVLDLLGCDFDDEPDDAIPVSHPAGGRKSDGEHLSHTSGDLPASGSPGGGGSDQRVYSYEEYSRLRDSVLASRARGLSAWPGVSPLRIARSLEHAVDVLASRMAVTWIVLLVSYFASLPTPGTTHDLQGSDREPAAMQYYYVINVHRPASGGTAPADSGPTGEERLAAPDVPRVTSWGQNS